MIFTHANCPLYRLIPFYRSHSRLSGIIKLKTQTHQTTLIHFKDLKHDFPLFLLAIQPVIASYQHHSNSSIKCPDVVSFCPFKPPTTTFCLHFIIKSTISIPPALPPFRLFILLLLAGDINPNPGPPRCPKVTYANIRSIHNKYPAIANLFLIMTPISLPCLRPG